MKIIAVLATAFFALLSASPAGAESRTALVVGNGRYVGVSTLPNPTRDAESVAQALQRNGYDVTLIKDGTLHAIKAAISHFSEAASRSDIALFYYAGHGVESQGENWLIPVDFKIAEKNEIANATINLRSITSDASKASTLGLIILDACRDNPFVAPPIAPAAAVEQSGRKITSRSLGKGLAPVVPIENVFVAFAAKDGTVANDGNGEHSPFTDALLRHVERRGLEISSLFRIVRDEVVAVTNGTQQPFVYGSLPNRPIYLAHPPAIDDATSSNGPSAIDPKFTARDRARVEQVAAEKQFSVPMFDIFSVDESTPKEMSRFVGVWSSKVGNNEGSGRQQLLIINSVSADGLAKGFYAWGPPSSKSWSQGPPNSIAISGYLRGDLFPFRTNINKSLTSVTAAWVKLGRDGTMAFQLQNGEGRTTWNTLYPIWRLTDNEPKPRQ